MRAGPPKIIESMVALLVPPASREHVLGDLRERYAGTRSYLSDAVSAVPGAIAGRIIRTIGWRLLAMEACVLYLSFLAGAWGALGAGYLFQHGGFLRLLLPVAVDLAVLAVADVYGSGERSSLGFEAAFGAWCGATLAVVSQVNGVPVVRLMYSAAAMGVVLSLSLRIVRMWFPHCGNRPRGEVL
jgi:hypothetical protein